MNPSENLGLPPSSPPPTAPAGFGRFFKHIALGAAMSGVLSSIPLFNCLNFFFCLLNIAGIALALAMYFKANPTDTMSAGEAAGFGAIAGAGAGLITGILNLIIGAAVVAAIGRFMAELNPQIGRQMAMQTGMGIVAIPINLVLYGGFGALGGFLSLLLFFKTHRRS